MSSMSQSIDVYICSVDGIQKQIYINESTISFVSANVTRSDSQSNLLNLFSNSGYTSSSSSLILLTIIPIGIFILRSIELQGIHQHLHYPFIVLQKTPFRPNSSIVNSSY